jgi:hypothetical protein
MNLSQTNIIITGCGRNVSPFVKGLQRTILKYASIFNKCECVFIESDSTDDTFERLTSLNNFINTTVISLGNLEVDIKRREERLAFCRNNYIDYILREYNNFDYMLVMDLDEMCLGPVSTRCIESNFKYEDWDMMCANVKGYYYDYHALRLPESNIFNERPVKLDMKDKLIRVKSAFGGAAFIKISSIGKARHNLKCGDTCEWVSLCESMSTIYINPAFVIQQIENSHIKKHING